MRVVQYDIQFLVSQFKIRYVLFRVNISLGHFPYVTCGQEQSCQWKTWYCHEIYSSSHKIKIFPKHTTSDINIHSVQYAYFNQVICIFRIFYSWRREPLNRQTLVKGTRDSVMESVMFTAIFNLVTRVNYHNFLEHCKMEVS